MSQNRQPGLASTQHITLFLTGDVMTGRGIDQILPHPSEPQLYEPYVRDARDYVRLAEDANGPIPVPVDHAYIWGDALAELARVAPDRRIINLETSVTRSNRYWPGKGINYRMHPANIACLTAIGVDCCVLANNHVLDWGYDGLHETIRTLNRVQIKTAGAGKDQQTAAAPAILSDKIGRVLVFAYGFGSSGVPQDWSATEQRAGINRLPDLSALSLQRVANDIKMARQPGDIVIVSLHWGGNWGYRIEPEQIQFAHDLIEQGGVDVIHGHSSHHPRAIEVYRGKPVFYSCGDLLNDYEGIGGHEAYRSDLSLLYFVTLERSSGKLVRLEMAAMQIRQFRLNRAISRDSDWLLRRINREGSRFGTSVMRDDTSRLLLQW